MGEKSCMEEPGNSRKKVMRDKSNTHIKPLVDSISLGEPISHGSLTIFSIHADIESIPFMTLRNALEKGLIQIMERSESGSVPELHVISTSDLPILLLDGEEIAGAKQNRILNTSILVPEKGNIIIPVTCTEEGRWSYDSPHFYDSDEMQSFSIRASKMDSVSSNLKRANSYASDQGEVWDGIRNMAREENIYSETGAMKDIYDNKRITLDRLIKNFPLQEDQNGLLVYRNSQPMGFDLVATSDVYAQYHEKLLRSYAIASSADRRHGKVEDDKIDGMSFIKSAASCTETPFKSAGLGWDYRYEGNDIIGSLLKAENSVIHAAFLNSRNPYNSYRDTGRIVRRRWFR